MPARRSPAPAPRARAPLPAGAPALPADPAGLPAQRRVGRPGMTGRERGRIHEQPEYSLNRAAKAITSRGVGALQALLVSGGFGAAHAASMCYALRYGCHHTQDKRYGTACSHYESRSLPARPITSTRGTLPGRRGAHRRMSSGRSSVPTGVTTSKLEQFRRRYSPQSDRRRTGLYRRRAMVCWHEKHVRIGWFRAFPSSGRRSAIGCCRGVIILQLRS